MAFGLHNVEIDPVRWELRRDGRPIVVQPLVFDLLLYFARRPNVLVTKEALIRDVWKGVVVGDGAIAQAVSLVRRAIGADGDAPAIRTVWGRGYRLVGNVREIGDGAGPVVRETAAPPAQGPSIGRAEVMALLERALADTRRTRRRDAPRARREQLLGTVVSIFAPDGTPASRRSLRRDRSPAWPVARHARQ